MKSILLAGILFLSAAPLVAAYAEGNGPSFPGLQVPNVGITTSTIGHPGGVLVTMDHTSQPDWDGGPTGPTHTLTARQARNWAMLDANTHG